MTLTASSSSHKTSILTKLARLRKCDVLCDVTLLAEGERFRAHKALLAASSDYFSQLFTADGADTYRLDGVAAAVCGKALEFIYSARVCVEEGAGEELLAAARLLQVDDLVGALQDTARRKRGRGKKRLLVRKRRKKSPSRDDRADERRDVADGSRGGEQPGRPERRKITPPAKYDAYKVGGDAPGGGGEGAEPATRGRKRKYPNAEARCHDCGKGFKNHLFLKIHRRTHTGEKPFSCQECGAAFTQKHTLVVHRRKHTGETPFVCSVCSKALATKHSLLEHMNLHQENKSFGCDKCEKSFSQRRQLKSHYRVHTGKSLPECAQCQRKFLDTAQLKKHLRTHTGEKPFTCEICGKCFSVKSTLQTHIRIHRGEKPYGCSVCDKSFSDSSARRRHVASHSGRRPYNCSACGLSFTRLDNLKTHINSHDKEKVSPPPQPEDQRGGGAGGGLQVQKYQLAAGPEQEIQLLVTGDNISLAAGQAQEIGLVMPQIATFGTPEEAQAAPRAEPAHVIALSKEAAENLHAANGPGQGPAKPHGRDGHADQPVSVVDRISGRRFHGHTFQIQAGTVSCLYTAAGPPPLQG
ncbi:zinc finger and BTB domain-containing protein 24 [Syngnathoides biaculeatus]|uniref:zinc finger and BTB domain-containing protein 24 n=1 Tax=Syngnathoides biaculeatus TaxID=300417 RepID=UPI002ADE112E|nr:zinc finger and BTB domain-containing protein 24 [Syngnathoides biaculeatus]XP_061700473.1 zinc finger and BTB domain-containing protein 24 [Syngnathoides biaculeatus]XP_061700474.1 zinc finger and BTB domain-containing protein 24 [Syngnathoides biaculeatus]XP_061700475.1 zinc finger and BTB domain-containing protein 24 [Syngnathoides biaculeatus]XP_061700477.1 zinc finger and BTB domain-containing protein 24 [Syngnathoides biaculeatus]XP_061700478.1 zinc finger and BTB domain-containing pr